MTALHNDRDPLEHTIGEAPHLEMEADSPSSQADAGLLTDPAISDTDFSDDEMEIPMADLDIESLDDPVTQNTVRSPTMDAPDTPGQIDIEALGDFDLDGTDLPADARLDPLEE